MVDIIIPTYGQEEHTVKCFKSILANTKPDYRLIWIDNGSKAESRAKAMADFLPHKNRLPVWCSANLGFVKGVNLGLKISTKIMDVGAEYVVIANNDIVVSPSWLERMLATFQAYPRIGALGPVTSNQHASPQWWQEAYKEIGTIAPPENFGTLTSESKSAFLQHRYSGQKLDVKMLCFFCTVFRREVFDKLGFLDERLGVGLGDDNDFSMRMTKAGYELAVALDAYVDHNHRTTFKAVYTHDEIKEIQKQNKDILIEKHGKII